MAAAPRPRATMMLHLVAAESAMVHTSKPSVAISPSTARIEAAPASKSPHTEPLVSVIPCDSTLAVAPYTTGAAAAAPPKTMNRRVTPAAGVGRMTFCSVVPESVTTVPRMAPTAPMFVTHLSLAAHAGPAHTEPANPHVKGIPFDMRYAMVPATTTITRAADAPAAGGNGVALRLDVIS